MNAVDVLTGFILGIGSALFLGTLSIAWTDPRWFNYSFRVIWARGFQRLVPTIPWLDAGPPPRPPRVQIYQPGFTDLVRLLQPVPDEEPDVEVDPPSDPDLYVGRHSYDKKLDEPEWRWRWAMHDTQPWPYAAVGGDSRTSGQLLDERPDICDNDKSPIPLHAYRAPALPRESVLGLLD